MASFVLQQLHDWDSVDCGGTRLCLTSCSMARPWRPPNCCTHAFLRIHSTLDCHLCHALHRSGPGCADQTPTDIEIEGHHAQCRE
eukprot:4630551-Amphidinium_carterae.1